MKADLNRSGVQHKCTKSENSLGLLGLSKMLCTISHLKNSFAFEAEKDLYGVVSEIILRIELINIPDENIELNRARCPQGGQRRSLKFKELPIARD